MAGATLSRLAGRLERRAPCMAAEGRPCRGGKGRPIVVRQRPSRPETSTLHAERGPTKWRGGHKGLRTASVPRNGCHSAAGSSQRELYSVHNVQCSLERWVSAAAPRPPHHPSSSTPVPTTTTTATMAMAVEVDSVDRLMVGVAVGRGKGRTKDGVKNRLSFLLKD